MGFEDLYSNGKQKVIYKLRNNEYRKVLNNKLKEIPERKLNSSELTAVEKKFGKNKQAAGWAEIATGLSGFFDPYYVPENVFHLDIKPKFNNMLFASVMSDKAYLDLYLNGKARTAETVLRCVNGRYLDRNFELITEGEVEKIYNSL